jgi:O-antigen/teichoic acid export membrane protein
LSPTAIIEEPLTRATPQLKHVVGKLANVVAGEGVLRLATLAAAVVIARLGGTAVFGMYATALAYVTIAAIIADNGFQITALREVSARPDERNHVCSSLYVSKTLLFVPMIVVLIVIGHVEHLPPLYWNVAALLTIRTMIQTLCVMQGAMLKAIDHVQVIGLSQGVHAAILLGAIWYFYVTQNSIYAVLLTLVVGQITEFCLEAVFLWRKGIRPVRFHLRECWRLVSGSAPIGITFALANGLLRVDVVVLSFIAGATSAGVFAAAQTVIVVVYVIAWLLGSLLLPDMVRLLTSEQAIKHYVRRWSVLVSVLVVPVSIVAMIAAPYLMRTVFGHAFDASGKLLAIMMAAVPFIVLNSIRLHYSVAERMSRVYLGIYVAALVLTVVLNTALAFAFGAVGVAVAVVVREASVYFAFLFLRPQGSLGQLVQA